MKKPAVTRCTTESRTLIIPTPHGITKAVIKVPVTAKPKIDQNANRRNRRKV